MPLRTKKVAVPRKNYQRQIRTYTVLSVVVLLAAGVWGFFQFQELSAAQSALRDGEERLAQMQSFEAQLSEQYATLQDEFFDEFQSIRESVQGVFPSEENYTNLTEELDTFVLALNRQSPSIFMSNLKYSQPRIDEDKGYGILPFTLTLETTRSNLEQFLAFAENSGSLDEATRLLDVRSITINFPGQTSVALRGQQQSNLLSVSLTVNAYFQLPADA